VWVNLGVGEGSEQQKRRPAVVLSNQSANESALLLGQGVVTVIPLTTRAGDPYPFQASVPQTVSGLSHDSIAQAEQIRSVDIRRIEPTRHVLPKGVLGEIEQAVKIHLALY
jgi:mRNA interferase MazF